MPNSNLFLSGSLSLAKIPSGPFYAIEMTVSDNGTNPGPKSTKIRLVMYNERSSSGTGAGSVYVGSSRASVPISAVSGTTVKVPVYANVGFQDLEGIDVTLRYNLSLKILRRLPSWPEILKRGFFQQISSPHTFHNCTRPPYPYPNVGLAVL